MKKEQELIFVLNNKEIIKGKRIIFKTGEIIEKYKNPKSGRYVSFEGLKKQRVLPEDIIEKLRVYYYTKTPCYDTNIIVMDVNPMPVLNVGEKFVRREELGYAAYIDIIKKEYDHIKIETGGYTQEYGTFEEKIKQISKILKETI